jgi:hypothetical protein
MSDAAKLRKLSRQMKLLEHLRFMNSNNLINYTAELASLQAKSAELDEADQRGSSLVFLDIRLAYRSIIETKMREISDSVDIEAGRSAVLKRQTETICKKAATISAHAQFSMDADQVQALMIRTRSFGSPALHKPKLR